MRQFIFMILTLSIYCNDAIGQKIVYDLPLSVVENIDLYISKDTVKNNDFVVLFATLDSVRYRVTIMNGLSATPNVSDLQNTLIKQTNRFIRVKGKLLPMITWEDIKFADFGTTYDPNAKNEKRKIGRKKIHFSTDDYGITFDAGGKIY